MSLPNLEVKKRRFHAQTMGILQKHEKLPKNEYQDLLRPVDCIVESHLPLLNPIVESHVVRKQQNNDKLAETCWQCVWVSWLNSDDESFIVEQS